MARGWRKTAEAVGRDVVAYGISRGKDYLRASSHHIDAIILYLDCCVASGSTVLRCTDDTVLCFGCDVVD